MSYVIVGHVGLKLLRRYGLHTRKEVKMIKVPNVRPLDKINYARKASPDIERLAKSPSDQKKLIEFLRNSGYPGLAFVASDFTSKYL